jgi:hypothetical protein
MPKQKSIKTKYLRRSVQRFLGFTRYRSPFEAVLYGVRTLEQWTNILNEERELELQLQSKKLEHQSDLGIAKSKPVASLDPR